MVQLRPLLLLFALALAAVPAAAQNPGADALIGDLDAVAGELYKHKESGDHAHLHPELTTSYARIYTMLASSDHAPPASARQRFEDLEPQFDRHMGRAQELIETDVAAFNQTLRERGIQPVSTSVPPD